MGEIRMLIIEDSEDDTLLLLRELKRRGIVPESLRVDTPGSFLDALARGKWDVIIADYNLPKFNALDALKWVHEKGIDLPFIIVSGAIGEETAVSAMKAGAHDYIKKGDFGRLIPAIEREMREVKVRSEKREAERALKESERLLRAVIDATPALIYVKDRDGRIILCNRCAAEWFRLTPDRMVGKTEGELFETAGEMAEGLEWLFSDDMEVIRTQSPHFIPDHPYHFPDGSLRHMAVTKVPLELSGKKDYVLTVSIDISEQIQAEEDRERMQMQLLQAQKMDAIGVLTGGVAHDFNNLLTAIHGCTDMALLRVEKGDPIYHDLREVQIASEKAADLTHQLLLFSRKTPILFVPLDLNKVIGDLLKMLHRLIGEDIQILTRLTRTLWPVRADRGTIEQVIMNLAVNARDAMPKGGTLTLATQNVVVNEAVAGDNPKARPGTFVCFQITDTGVGIDPVVLPHIFEPFFSTKAPGKGTGLGLSVAYGIVLQHEGWIEVASTPGSGSTFTVYLPAAEGAVEIVEEEETRMEQYRGGGERILLVEDEEGLRRFMDRALTKYGYEVVETSNVREALDVYNRESGAFDLVLTDVVLPGESGIEFVERLYRLKRDIRVLLTSGYTDQKSQWPVIQEKGYPFLQKPFTLAGLLRTVHEMLNT
jgi:PAS domain S-box-containing protein